MIIPFVLCLFLLKFNYFNSLNLINIIPPNSVIITLLAISYVLKLIGVFKIHNFFDFDNTKDFNKYLYTNALFNLIAVVSISYINSLFLAFASLVVCLISNLFLYYEMKSYDSKTSKFLIFSLYFSLISCSLMLVTYFMNL